MNLRAARKHTIALLVLIAALLVGVLTHDHGIELRDDGNIVRAAHRVLAGEVPYLDFKHFFYAPGRVYLLAAIYDLFGESYLASRWMWVVVRALLVLLVYFTGRELMPPVPALLPAAVVLLVPGPWFKTFYPFCGMFAFYAMLLYVRGPTALRAGILGGAVAFGLFFRQDMGMASMGAGALCIALANVLYAPRQWRRLAVHLAVMLAVTVGLLGPFLLYMASQDALAPMVEQLFREAPGMTATRHEKLLPALARLWENNPSCFLLGCCTPPVATLGGAVVLVVKRRVPEVFTLTALLLVMNVATVVPAYLPILLMRFLQANHFTLILLVYSLYLLAEHLLSKVEHEPAARLLRGGAYALIAVIPALLVHHVFTSHESPVSTGALPSLMALDQPVSFRGETIYLGERMYVRGGSGTRASDVERVMGYVERYTEPGEPVVFMPNQSMYYYICDRPNPLAYIGLWAHRYVLDDQVAPAIIADYLDDLERVEPRYVFVGTTFHMGQAPALVDYLEQTYPNVKMVKDMDLVIFDNSETGGGARFLGARAVVDWKRYTPARIRRQGESADR